MTTHKVVDSAFSIQAHSLAPDLSHVPNPVFAKLRSRDALHYSPSYNAWLVSRYADSQFVLGNAPLFRVASQQLIGSPERWPIDIADLTCQRTKLFNLAKSFTYNISAATPFDFIQVFANHYVVQSFIMLFKLNATESERLFKECRPKKILKSHTTCLEGKRAYLHASPSSFTILSELFSSTSIITIQLLTRALHLLTLEPELWRKLYQSPTTIAPFLEEAWRLYSPYSGILMHTQKELVLYGTSIPAQSRIVALSSSANRDPDQFQRPNTFYLNRPNISHYQALGNGKDKFLSYKLCLQLSVAAIEAFLTSFKSISMARETSPEFTRSFLTLRFDRLMLSARK